ncbi:alpha/beta fold hydrolase [Hoeflea prorocentri]|uniref:Alpha/beta hydrolase n=1 Tax=Hoeflea prorocentri TaxID=1922333 RepID=A0A9X3ZGB9_9HYPH|nr:alpha/beta hydrolase [Hoeflea prorocentri]MCY6379753.1 alpha/beta hydrolase [Hoeflea prorocentri]MDA5397553.1 alpha/beta hydrolase [Hoeflea prorocentri]
MPEMVERRENGIAYIERPGPGPVVVLLHGIGSNASSFMPLIECLPDHLHLILWNAPGYMGSKPLAEAWPLPSDYARALAGLLDDIGISTVHLFGHSLGTLIAAEFARQHPNRVDRLVLASAANGYGISQGDPLPEKAAGRIEELERLGPEVFARSRAANLVHEPAGHPDVVAHVEEAMAQVRLPGYGQAVHMLASGDLAAMIGTVPVCPGFIIGAQDRITPMDQTQKAAGAWAAVHGHAPALIAIEEAGHAAYVQRPQRFASALLELLGEPATRSAYCMARKSNGENHV